MFLRYVSFLTRLSIEVVQYARFQNDYFWNDNSFIRLRIVNVFVFTGF